MQKWFIPLGNQEPTNLSEEMRQLGDLLRDAQGEHYLVFRDSFVALKVANSLGLKRELARVIPADQVSHPLLHLGNGKALVADSA